MSSQQHVNGTKGATWCGAPNCTNNSKRNPDLSFFRFPRTEDRAKEWVNACRRLDLSDRTPEYLYNSVRICSDHFEDRMYYNFLKNRLKANAIPTIFNFPDAHDLINHQNRLINRRNAKEFNRRLKNSEEIESWKGFQAPVGTAELAFSSPDKPYTPHKGSSKLDFRLPIDCSQVEFESLRFYHKESPKIDFRLPIDTSQEDFEGEEDSSEVDFLIPVEACLNSCDTDMTSVEPIIVVHGGAGNYTYANIPLILKGIRAAAVKGHQVLQSGGSILDATVAAVEIMEDDPQFNAGKGSVLTLEGKIEMEALIMEGKDMKVGSVTGLKNVAHPISVAKLVMDLPHSILGFQSATDFAHGSGVPFVPDSDLITADALTALENFKKKGNKSGETEIPGTVGAVGIDGSGHMVSCTSTGGMNGKMSGRVGDTPIPGSGGYCDDNIGTVSATGNGESILRYNVSQRILAYLESGKTAQEATRLAVEGMTQRVGAEAGAITIAKNGDVGIAFTSKRMSWAYVKGSKLYYGIDPNQVLEEDLQ